MRPFRLRRYRKGCLRCICEEGRGCGDTDTVQLRHRVVQPGVSGGEPGQDNRESSYKAQQPEQGYRTVLAGRADHLGGDRASGQPDHICC